MFCVQGKRMINCGIFLVPKWNISLSLSAWHASSQTPPWEALQKHCWLRPRHQGCLTNHRQPWLPWNSTWQGIITMDSMDHLWISNYIILYLIINHAVCNIHMMSDIHICIKFYGWTWKLSKRIQKANNKTKVPKHTAMTVKMVYPHAETEHGT